MAARPSSSSSTRGLPWEREAIDSSRARVFARFMLGSLCESSSVREKWMRQRIIIMLSAAAHASVSESTPANRGSNGARQGASTDE